MAPDVSQRSYQSRIRNERYQMHSLDGKSLMTWSLPEMGIVELGGVTGKRPPLDDALVGFVAINKLVRKLQESHPGGKPEGQLLCLRLVSSLFLVDALQMRKFMGQLAVPEQRDLLPSHAAGAGLLPVGPLNPRAAQGRQPALPHICGEDAEGGRLNHPELRYVHANGEETAMSPDLPSS